MRKLLFAFAFVAGFSASALTVATVSDDATGDAGSDSSHMVLAGNTPPEKPSGDEKPGGDNPPDKPSGGGETGGGETGGPTPTIPLTGVLTVDGVTTNVFGETFTSSLSDQNVILAKCAATLSVSNCTMIKTGNHSNEDQANFFAVNAVVTAQTNAMIYVENSRLFSDAKGANGLFASGTDSTIYAYGCTISSTNDSSRGLDATYMGTVIASKMSIETKGSHCAAFATDRGNGRISAKDSTVSTAGQGSPLIYSTGVIEVNGVTGTAYGAQIAGIEGLSTIRIRNSGLAGSAEKASESVPNGVIIYQSGSGDYTEGTATFEVSDSALDSSISDGAMFYVTHSAAFITVRNTTLDFDTDSNHLILAAGNDGENGWGTAGSNGADVVFTAIDQDLKGTVSVDGISTLDLYLTNTTYTGTFDTTNSADGVNVFISSDSRWTVTGSCTLDTLTASEGATIVDDDDRIVSIYNSTSGKTVVSGASDLTITVTDYKTEDFVTTNITAFAIERTAFEARYGTSDHDNWTYCFKPHPPDHAIVKVKVAGATDYGLPDKDHKYCLDGYWDGNENGVEVRLLYVTKSGYVFADGGTSNVWVTTVTNNAQEVYPPEDVVAVKAQAKSGSTDYLTLKAAIDAAGKRARITLYDSVTLEEPLTVTNALTLDLCTNTLTLSGTLTNAFHFTAGATVSNGTINSSLAANAAGSVLMRFTDCKATLRDLTVNGAGYETVVAHDSEKTPAMNNYAMTCDGIVLTGNGCLLSVDYADATLTNACSFTVDKAVAPFGEHAAAIYCTENGTVSILSGTYSAPTILLSEDFGVFLKSDDVTIDPPDGYVWEDGRLVEESSVEKVTPGVASEPYDDAATAADVAAEINADKASRIAIPTGVVDESKAVYLGNVEATVTSDNCVVIDLTPAARSNEQAVVDAAVTNETAVASLVSADASATVTIAATTPGLYYWIEGGEAPDAVTEPGAAQLSTNGGAVELAKPTLDATIGRAFFRISAGVSAPAAANGNE